MLQNVVSSWEISGWRFMSIRDVGKLIKLCWKSDVCFDFRFVKRKITKIKTKLFLMAFWWYGNNDYCEFIVNGCSIIDNLKKQTRPNLFNWKYNYNDESSIFLVPCWYLSPPVAVVQTTDLIHRAISCFCWWRNSMVHCSHLEKFTQNRMRRKKALLELEMTIIRKFILLAFTTQFREFRSFVIGWASDRERERKSMCAWD